jgi:hypothetical protein
VANFELGGACGVRKRISASTVELSWNREYAIIGGTIVIYVTGIKYVVHTLAQEGMSDP